MKNGSEKMGTDLRGLRLLVVEDEALIAMMIHDIVCDAGATVVSIAGNIETAMSTLDTETVDGAILDVNLGGNRVDPLADLLDSRNIPFMFLTGYGQSGIGERFPTATVMTKPFDDNSFLETVGRALGRPRN